MTVDPRTVAAYEAGAKDYADRFETDTSMTQRQQRFTEALPAGGHILDYGCGPGSSAARFMAAGFTVDAFDATPAMVELAQKAGVPARVATFDMFEAEAAYDGIWANFALLHAPRDRLPDHIAAIAKALRPGGAFHIGMKLGSGMARDTLDRRYTYVTRDELADMIAQTGLALVSETRFEEVGFAGTLDPGIVMLWSKHA